MRVIDLSQPLSRETQLHPFFGPTQILRHIVHADAPEGRPSFNAEVIVTSNHAATHVDAFAHYSRGGAAIAEMPLDTFCGGAVCVDIREYPRGHDVSAAEVERAVEAGAGAEGIGLVYASMSPYESADAAARLARRLGVPWVADLRDPWALDEMLVFPTGLAVGPDGAFYVSERGFGFGAGQGQILRIQP